MDPLLLNRVDVKALDKSVKLMENELDQLNMNTFCINREKAGPHGVIYNYFFSNFTIH